MSVAVQGLIALAVLIGLWRTRARGWRDPRCWLQPIAGLLLAATLFPPSIPVDRSVLTVLTPGVSAEQRSAMPWRMPTVVLPGVVADGEAPFADLASALRAHPEASTVQVIGQGLPPRDQGALGSRGLRFERTAISGIVALDSPAVVTLGQQWQLSGRVAGAVVKLSLHDPSGAEVDAATPDGEGGFRLAAIARAPGVAQFELRARDAADGLLDHAAIPLQVEAGERLQLRYRAGTPDADAKYWRRWAQDAGLAVAYRAGLSEGVALSADDAALNAETLATTDLLVIDDRAWGALMADEKAAVLAAVDDGLGLILKAVGPLEPGVAAEWAALGFATTAVETPPVLSLDRALAMRTRASFTAAPLSIDDDRGITALLRADDGSLLAGWRPRGNGRIALWRLLDSYRLVLAGEAARHGALWGSVIAQLGRAVPAAVAGPQRPTLAWVDERAVFCGLGDAASLLSPDGQTVALVVGKDGCAAAWPGEPGWHQLQTAAERWPWFVRAADDAAGLRAKRDGDATDALMRESSVFASSSTQRQLLPRWPWFLAWLAVISLLWWRERQA